MGVKISAPINSITKYIFFRRNNLHSCLRGEIQCRTNVDFGGSAQCAGRIRFRFGERVTPPSVARGPGFRKSNQPDRGPRGNGALGKGAPHPGN
ncbi:hypothetical protein CDAR_252481 [Caerostris darwini]|uniref:Uncharacterized protein n=1 Tax=Caerostris darwini TaxID=1538125 RepID=A0AAV4WI50_9ARAC|nr:hypothetical protein CDAR_252481 [Caerostris darwini]